MSNWLTIHNKTGGLTVKLSHHQYYLAMWPYHPDDFHKHAKYVK